MHPVHGFHREALEQAVVHHAARAGAAFFGRLEDQVDGAVEVAVLRQIVGCTQQHRCVPVMTTSMHLAGVARRVIKCVEFLHRQGVHVGTQADGAVRGAVLDDADDTRHAQPADDGDAPFGEARGHHVGRALFFVAEFGMGVDVAPDRFELGLVSEYGFDQSHSFLLMPDRHACFELL